ncbi:MAG: hypothetical protein EMLJLAPB_00417 [Candidatus Argoarchaeum ethanivorans]|uniref:Uncharacterized protein n=1 Tax=Candidatus Argoarchaeum ethanivorans TaxID=2608793 RepID=A0A811TBL0_9EURY|nr:MAG: hypothetical protein EMLJLAPB_00417 [Candidatus Argoarchaeum ethanivorans]
MSAEKRIFGEGFSSGILAGIAIKTGISVDEGIIMTMIMKAFCEATEGMQSSFNCWGFVVIISLLALLASGVAIFEAVTNADDWRVGAMIYGAGFIVGVLLIVIFA